MNRIRIKGPGVRHLDPSLQARRRSRGRTLNDLGPVVYAVRTKDGLVKIGFTTALARRSSQVGAGIDAILAVRLGATEADERAIHDVLAEHVARGREYYHPTPAVLALLNELRSDLGMAPITEDDVLPAA